MIPIKKVVVREGQVVVAERPTEFVTILGSCVAVCLWDKKTKTGGMNHYLLPTSKDGTSHPNRGETATRMLIRSMIGRNSEIKNIEAKVFGGANQFFHKNSFSVGVQNVDAAKKVLEEAGIPIISGDTGGELGRKIIFNTQTGIVRVRLIPQTLIQVDEEANKRFGLR